MRTLLRRLLIGLAIAIAAVLLCVAVLFGLLIWTRPGADRVVALLMKGLPPGSLTVREVRGSLASPFELRGVEFRTATFSITADRVIVHWSLGDLFARKLDVHSLVADSVHVRQLAGAPPDTTRTPTVLPDLRLPIDLRVHELAIHGFAYQSSGGGAPFVLDGVHAAARYRADSLELSAFTAHGPLLDADVRGRLHTSGEYPLDADLQLAVRPSDRLAFHGSARVEGTLDSVRVTARLDRPFEADVKAALTGVLDEPFFDGRVQFTGLDPCSLGAATPAMRIGGWIEARGTIRRLAAKLAVSMRSPTLVAADATAACTLAGDSLDVSELVVTLPRRPERVRVQGLLTGVGGAPRADLTAEWQNLRWPFTGDTLVRSERGRLALRGTTGRYAVEVAGRFATADMDLGEWQVNAEGDTSHLDVSSLEGRLAGGSTHASGTVAWRPQVRWTGFVQGDSLDPGTWWHEWPGRVSLEVEGEGSMRGKVAAVSARLTHLGGTVKELPVTAEADFESSGPAWSVPKASATWGSAKLEAAGTGGESWDLAGKIAAPDLGLLIPGAAGALSAQVAVTGPRLDPSLSVRAHGDTLVLPGATVGELQLSLRGGMAANDSLRLELEARRVMLAGRPLDQVTARGDGWTRDHRFEIAAEGSGDTLALAFSGGLANQRWTGRVNDLDLRTSGSGRWSLESPVPVELAAKEARVDSFGIHSGGGSLRGSVGWRAGHALRANAVLATLPMNVLGPLLPPGSSLSGRFDGSVQASAVLPDGPLVMQAHITQTPSEFIYSLTPTQRDTFAVGAGRLDLAADADSVRGDYSIAWDNGDLFEAHASLPGFNPLRPDTAHQPVRGRVRLRATDLTYVGDAVPGLDDTRGELTADLTIGGTLARSEVRGQVLLKGGRAAFPALGVQLEDATLTVQGTDGRRLTLEGSMRSGSGTVTLNGTADFTNLGKPTATLAVKGKDFKVANTRQADVRVSPDLQASLSPSRLDVSGQVDVPFARIMTVEGLENIPVPPSADVVLVGEEQRDSLSAGPQLYSRVRVVIGDDVEIRVPRFRGKPEGSILTIDEPGQVTRATGELKVTEGTYRAYGQDLRIERGRLFFGGGPISNPGLDLRASRTAGDGTVAGVQITGTAELPELRIFSVPTMSENDALSYIMFGKSASETGGSGGATSQAAGQLGVQGSDMLARGVAGKLGIPDASVESKEGTMQDASVFLGTYLSPKLYVSYGIGLFESSSTLRVRYKMSKHWSVQTESGATRSGVVQYSNEH